MNVLDTLEALKHAADEGRTAVLVTVISVDGQVPSHPGARLVVADDTVLAGTLGCSEFDAAATDLAGELIAGGQSTVRRRAVFGHGEVRALDLFAEAFPPAPAVVVVGDTPVGRAVAELARFVGRRPVVLDADPMTALGEQRLGPADAVVAVPSGQPVIPIAVANSPAAAARPKRAAARCACPLADAGSDWAIKPSSVRRRMAVQP